MCVKDGQFVEFTQVGGERCVGGRITCVEMGGRLVDVDVDGMNYTFQKLISGAEWKLVGEFRGGLWLRTNLK